MPISAVRFVFRIIQLSCACSLTVLLVAPKKTCRERVIEPDGYELSRCIRYEIIILACPYPDVLGFPIPNSTFPPSFNERCPVRITELVWASIAGGVFSLIYLIDLLFAKRLLEHRRTSESRKRVIYMVMISLSISTWASVSLAVAAAYAVRWPKALKDLEFDDPHRIQRFEGLKRPFSWIIAMFLAAVLMVVNITEYGVVLARPDKYL